VRPPNGATPPKIPGALPPLADKYARPGEHAPRKRNKIKGFGIALAAHLLIFSTGGLLFSHSGAEQAKKIEEVDLVDPSKPPPEKEKPQVDKEIRAEPEQMPDARELADLNAPLDAPPALDAMSLSALESALNGAGGAPGFNSSVGFGSGGQIGGQGLGGTMDGGPLSSGDLDQKPRPLFQTAPTFPASMRKTGGTVSLMVTVDAQGNVTKVDVEKASSRELEAPAMEAVRKWKFEPGTRDGKKVPFKMRVPITFSA
jgi:protein TonB